LGVETKKRFPSGPPKSRQRINSFTNAEKSEILSSEPVKRVIQSFACSEYARMLNERPADFSTWLLSRASEELDYYNPQRGVSIPKFLAFRLKKICIEEMRSRFGRTGKKRIFRHETPGESPGINSLQKPLSTLPPYLTTPDLMRALLKANRNLTPGEREAVELYLEHGNFVDAGIARAMKRGKSRKSLIVPQYVSW
jgi:hypothetical protein